MSELPKGWEPTQLGHVVQLKTGPFGSALHQSDYVQGGTPLINPTHIRGGRLKPDPLISAGPEKTAELREFRLMAGDVVMGRRGEMGRCAVVPQSAEGWLCGTGSVIVRPTQAVSPTFLQRFLSAPSTVSALVGDSVGSTMVNLNQKILLGLSVALPPVSEQRRIADKLDSVLTRVDAVNNRLARVAPILKRFRQSVLAAATSGRLTEDWRSGAQANWPTLRAEEACAKVQSGGTPKGGFLEEGIPFLKVYNIVDQKVAFDYKPQYVSAEVNATELRKSQVQPGDVLMNIVGPPLGKVAIVPSEHSAWNINQAITLFRPSEQVSSLWIYFVLCEGAPIREVLNRTKGSVGQVNISLSQCRAFELPIPPADEQAEIVRRVETLFAFADRLEARLQAAQTATERLTPALLAKAFRGELVPQDPNDEPASELLKRLATTAPDGKPKRGRSKASTTA